MTSAISAPPAVAGIDPRGPRLAASLTSVVLALVLVAPRPAAIVLLALQTVVFAIGAGRGIQHTPYAALFRSAVRPRLSPPGELEDPRPPRFAQGLGLAFSAVGLVGFLAGVTAVGLVATGLALVAALLNAVFGLCLGCELYLILRRAIAR
ncbi:MAG: DUF4395 domain-containing protein [Nocardioides sp.]